MSMSKKVEWRWEENGVWKTFPAGNEAELEREFTKNKSGTFTTTIMSRTYQMDLGKMIQTNTSTGFSRNLRRLVNGVPTPSPSSTGSLSLFTGYVGSSTSSGTPTSPGGTKTQRPPEVYKTPPISKGSIDFPVAKEEDLKDQECPICMDDFSARTEGVKMKECLGHVFHKDCIYEAMVKRSTHANVSNQTMCSFTFHIADSFVSSLLLSSLHFSSLTLPLSSLPSPSLPTLTLSSHPNISYPR